MGITRRTLSAVLPTRDLRCDSRPNMALVPLIHADHPRPCPPSSTLAIAKSRRHRHRHGSPGLRERGRTGKLIPTHSPLVPISRMRGFSNSNNLCTCPFLSLCALQLVPAWMKTGLRSLDLGTSTRRAARSSPSVLTATTLALLAHTCPHLSTLSLTNQVGTWSGRCRREWGG